MKNVNLPLGEWKVAPSGHPHFELCITSGDGGSVCHITRWSSTQDDTAHLLSASKELLVALIDCKKGLEDVWLDKEEQQELIRAADKAINKALNKTQ